MGGDKGKAEKSEAPLPISAHFRVAALTARVISLSQFSKDFPGCSNSK
jgi:hypothetical protein